jgi:nucleotide-binding universal stress UspA family protein
MTCKILLPVDGSDGCLRAVKHATHIAGMLKDLEVHLINVQPTGDDWMVRRMIKKEELAKMEQEWAEDAMAPAREVLQAADVRFLEHCVQGDVGPTLVQQAEALGCDQIVMGTRGLTALGDLLMGSVARKVLHLAKIPVTLVK